MFKKILIANRGEIACRVIKTARRMGIATVAVYSDADRDAPHVEMADEAVWIGPPPAPESYLAAGRILAACKAAGADAVHPGYGFLSEQAAFARALAANGIAFIGPNPRAMEAMGDKIEAKKMAQRRALPSCRDFMASSTMRRQAAEIAASHRLSGDDQGFGGRRRQRDAHRRIGAMALPRALQAPRRKPRPLLATAGCSSKTFIERPRHIEIQVLGDKHGNVIHLGERECSIQRRHQKLIEEAPSPFIGEKTRSAMGEQAAALARAVNYDSAGTVEFIAAQDGRFYFLEMNTRLQVEHPVTELDHRHRSCRADDPVGLRRAPEHRASRGSSARLGGGIAYPRGGSGPQFSSFRRTPHVLPAAFRRA